jgi:NAD(P)-dependent dehydrogenase (short-subunit alcohol dehydrogenase family)
MISSLFDITGKVAVVTGAAGGIGQALVRGLSDCGAYVVGADLRDPADFPSINARFKRTDVTLESEVEALVEEACAHFGKIDIMIANAAIGGGARAEEETSQGWDRVMAVNAKGSFLCARGAARRMKDQGGGAIIQIASVLSFIGYPTAVAYTASKGAVAQMTRTLATEWARFDIRVNAIAPGFIRTPMNEAILKSEEYLRPVIAKIPLGRAGEPEEIVGTVVYLASDAGKFVTGSVIVVDGGELASGGYTEGVMPYIYDLI